MFIGKKKIQINIVFFKLKILLCSTDITLLPFSKNKVNIPTAQYKNCTVQKLYSVHFRERVTMMI